MWNVSTRSIFKYVLYRFEVCAFSTFKSFYNNFLSLSKFNVRTLAPEVSMAVCMQDRGEPKPCAL